MRLGLLEAPVAHHVLFGQGRLLNAMSICLYWCDGPSEIYPLRWMLFHWHLPGLALEVWLPSRVKVESELIAIQARVSHVERCGIVQCWLLPYSV